MPAKKGFVSLVNFAVRPKHITGGIKIAFNEALPHALQHGLEYIQHLNQLFRIVSRQRVRQVVYSLRHAPKQIADSL